MQDPNTLKLKPLVLTRDLISLATLPPLATFLLQSASYVPDSSKTHLKYLNSETSSKRIPSTQTSHSITIILSWQARWDTSRAASNKLPLIKPTVERWSSSTQRARHREVVLACLLIVHTRLTHGYLMKRSDPPRFPSCYVPLSRVHFLVDCPRYASLRRSLFPSMPSHPQFDCLSPTFDCDALFAFLMRSTLLSEL